MGLAVFVNTRKLLFNIVSWYCFEDAEGETRTRTPLRALRPERSVYTISPLRQEYHSVFSVTQEIVPPENFLCQPINYED